MPLRLLPAAAFLFLLATLAPSVQGQKAPDKPTPGDEMIYKYLCAEADKLSAKYLDGAKTLEEWQQKRPRLHQEYLDMLGLWPLPEKTPLKATVTRSFRHEEVMVENLHFQSKPGLYVTANFYHPVTGDVKKKYPTILYVCGHANKGRDGNKSAHQDHGMWFASNGYNCLVLDSLQLGEIPGVHHGTHGRPYNHLKAYGIDGKDKVEPRWWWHSAGYTPAGVECWNGIRAIDYLLTRADVDKERIGVTGISGGGAATFWIAAADERVKVAVPVSGMSDLESYVKNKVINGHCDCMFLYNTYQWDLVNIAALVAPRPLLFANSDNDNIFPMDGNRRIMAKLDKIYALYGKPDLVGEYVSKGGHAYRPDLRVAIFRYLNRHLKNDLATPVKDVDFKPIPGKDLRVFPTDADIPKDALNGKIDETFVPRAKVALPEKGKFEEWKSELLRQLKDKPFRGFDARIPAATLKAHMSPNSQNAETEPGISTWLYKPAINGPRVRLYIMSPALVAQEFGGGGDVYAPRGLHGDSWSTKSPPNFVERSHALLGQTIEQKRVWDVIATAKAVARDQKIILHGKGQTGILAAYAALFEPAIKEVVIIDPPKSHMEGPHFPGVLRVLDIPEALGMLAPTPLTLINAQDPAFDRTAELYRLAGAADKLTRK